MKLLPKLVRAGLKTGSRKILEQAFNRQQLIKMPEVSVNKAYKAAAFRSALAAFNSMHNWHSTKLHPCFPQVLGFNQQLELLLHRSSLFPLMGLVHLGNQIIVNRLLENKDLSLTFQFGKMGLHQKGITFCVEMNAFQANELCISSRSDYLFRTGSQLEESPPRFEKIHKTIFELERTEMNENPLATMQLKADTGRKYAKVSGDYNPIHLTKWTAKMFGFKQPIAHGMHTLARAVSAIHAKRQQEFDSHTISNEFFNAAFLPCNLQLQAPKNHTLLNTEQFKLINKNVPQHKQVVTTIQIQADTNYPELRLNKTL
jgi:hypothetical protein